MSISIKRTFKGVVAVAAVAAAAQAGAEITFYQHEGFNGRSFTTYGSINNLDRYGLNDKASSVVVDNQRYEVCDDANFGGRCVVLRPGSYASLAAVGLNNQISSVRPIPQQVSIDDRRYGPPPVVVYDYRRRGQEPLYEASVVQVRAIVGPPEQRCWIERERVARVQPNVGGAVAGAVIGGILGHQIGAGSGRDAATAGGAIAGAAIGANVDSRSYEVQRVQHCTTAQSTEPEYWDVAYVFRGTEHHVQMTQPPGPTVVVNQYGEPRVG
ncbi:MAG TPA: beta/gamma crystallin-related protein [Ideonella sp.]|jgi:uncharacterized protein YcfJ|nr:beta/gamma crystallin-related protein [Ideonella sp.]